MNSKKPINISLPLFNFVGVGGSVTHKTLSGTPKVINDSTEQGIKIAQYANPDAFITPLQLFDLMENSRGVVVIGTLDPTKLDTQIKGSFTMWRDDYSASEGVYEFDGMANTAEQMETILSTFGVEQDTIIVIYASNDHHDAARLWWQIKLLGHKDVRYLDGGLNAWISAGYPTGNTNPTVEATVYKAPNPITNTLATFDDVVAVLNDSSTVIVDTRSQDEERGVAILSGSSGPGKIFGAEWISWRKSNREDTTLKSFSELKEIYGHLEGKKVITYCQLGFRSAHTLLVLTQVLGIDNVQNYDGSWIEWSYQHYIKNNPSAVIENGQ